MHDVVKAATDAGIPADATQPQGAVFLGGLDRGVSPLSMAAAYATFASGGIYAQPYGIKTIRDSRGEGPAGRVVVLSEDGIVVAHGANPHARR